MVVADKADDTTPTLKNTLAEELHHFMCHSERTQGRLYQKYL